MLIEGSFCDCEGEEFISQGRCAVEVSMVFGTQLGEGNIVSSQEQLTMLRYMPGREGRL